MAALSGSGWYRTLYAPLIAPFVGTGVIIPALIYFLVPAGRRYFEKLGLFWLPALHIWRIPATVMFFWYDAEDLLPDTFVRNAAWDDLLAGLFAGVLIVAGKTRGRYLGFHHFGFEDFVLAVRTGLTFTLLQDPKIGPIADLPLALIPLWRVGISGASHIIAFDLLRRRKGL